MFELLFAFLEILLEIFFEAAFEFAAESIGAFIWRGLAAIFRTSEFKNPLVAVVGGMDAVHRANIHARGVFCADTRLGNHISHSASPLFACTRRLALRRGRILYCLGKARKPNR